MVGVFVKFFNPGRKMVLYVMGFVAIMIVFYQFWEFPTERYFSESSLGEQASLLVTVRSVPQQEIPTIMNSPGLMESVDNNSSELGDDKDLSSMRKLRCMWNRVKQSCETVKSMEDSQNVSVLRTVLNPVTKINTSAQQQHYLNALNGSRLGTDARNLTLETKMNTSAQQQHYLNALDGPRVGTDARNLNLMTKMNISSPSIEIKDDTMMLERYVRRMRGATVTLSEMKSMLINGPGTSNTSRRKWSSPRDRELASASFQIKNAPILRNFPDFHAPLFRNASTFKRSYELMVRLLKIYVYKEGEKPIFHQPMLHGIYAAEGWFMKLMEKSKHFVVKDPKKAHLFYLPVSANLLRNTLNDRSLKDLELYLSDYVDSVRRKHRFWNRTGGADHFLVACHDWGPRITSTYVSNCIRALCNTNILRGFTIGKDVSIPVTYIRSANEPTRDIGGKRPSDRPYLAFFAGQMHGYVRPLLLKYWENKISDMKIFGPMNLDTEGKSVYRNYMKSSKFCICGRGYEVHTPRVVESIFYECVPVIISDNYVPPFFDVLDWEAFAVFVLEKDIPNLRNILLSIPEHRYLEMHSRVKMVQRHFIWHKNPVKYDLFHMILHSIWSSRVSQMRPI